MQITQPEVKAIAAAFRNPEALRTSGVYLGGLKYMYLQSDEAQIQAKKGPAGVAIAKSNKCMFHIHHYIPTSMHVTTKNLLGQRG